MFLRYQMRLIAFVFAALGSSPVAAATLTHETMYSPFGGIVVEAQGFSGDWLVSQTPASELNKGAPRGDPEINDFFIGQQDGFNDDLLGQMGGGFSTFTIRITVFDGDNDPGNFDFDDNYLRINGIVIGSLSDVITTTTNAVGDILNGFEDGLGFGNDETDTGIITITDEATLEALFASLSETNTLFFEIDKRDESGNFFDFTSRSRIPYADAGLAPTLVPVPLPATAWLLLVALGGLGVARRRSQS